MRRWLLWVVVAALVCTACQPIDEATEAESDAPVPRPTTTTTELQDPGAVPLPTPAPTVAVVDDQRGAPEEFRATDYTRLRSDLPASVALTGGRRLTITFNSGTRGTYESACAWDHRLDIEETEERVSVSIVAIRVLSPLARMVDCLTESEPWAVTTTLQRPVSELQIVDAVTGREIRGVQIETRLLPTWLPDDWYLLTDDRLLPQRTMVYTSPDGVEEGRYEVLTSPISMSPRLSDLRRLLNWEELAVRRDGDGVIVPLADGSYVLGFEEQGWYYQIQTEPGADERALIQFARSFERPALAEPGTMTSEILFAVEDAPLQAGQEEGESGWLMLLPGDRVVQ